MKFYSAAAILTLSVFLAAGPASAEAPASTGQWSKETLEKFATIPVLDNGRLKPLDTYASFKLLKFNGKRTYNTVDDERLTSLEWLLDCLFYPSIAEDYAHFSIDNSEIVTSIGAMAHSDLRDRYTYKELLPGRTRLFELAREHSMIDDKARSANQRMIMDLAQNINEFELITHYFEFARIEFNIQDSAMLSKIFDGAGVVSMSDVVRKGPEVRQAIMAMDGAGGGEEGLPQSDMKVLTEIFNSLDFASNFAVALALIPPSDMEDAVWKTPADVIGKTFSPEQPSESEMVVLLSMERLANSVDNKLAFDSAVANFHALVVGQAEARDEYSKIPLEVSFYKGKYFFYAQWLFVFSFALIALSWLVPQSKLFPKVNAVAVSVPLALLVVGITYRCIIRGRPPVSTLYETILFITAIAVLVALFMEFANRQRIAIAIASIMGVMGLFLANRFEMSGREDTMPQLVAVLDTNFWLSTHVTTVTMGYAAGLLAAAVAHIFIIGKLFNFKKNDKAFYRTVTRMVYGIICFALIFSFVGTVLGGIWANYSWGRFWGWDPKENGALMIVLCNIAILHARNGGYIKQMGIHLAAVFAGCVVAFSWWGVNLLGVGLHSYGFTAGIWNSLITFWGLETFVLLLGFGVLLRAHIMRKAEENVRAAQMASNEPIAK